MAVQSVAQSLHDLKPLGPERYLVAIVRDNNDPEMLQRIRVEIPGLIEGADLETLPWMFPKHSSPYGVGNDYGVVRIPRIGAKVVVTLQDGDPQFGVYESDLVTADNTLPAEFQTNYPNRVGFYTPAGDLCYVDLGTKELLYRRASGTALSIDAEGNVNIVCAKNWTQTVQGDYTLMVQGDATTVVSGDATASITGSSNTSVGGDSNLTVSGSQVENASGTRTVSCSSETHAGATSFNADINVMGIHFLTHKHSGVQTGGGSTNVPF